MTQGIILIQGDNIRDDIRDIGLSNAKHLLIGDTPGFGTILHIAANTSDDFNNALTEFLKIPDVKVVTMALRS